MGRDSGRSQEMWRVLGESRLFGFVWVLLGLALIVGYVAAQLPGPSVDTGVQDSSSVGSRAGDPSTPTTVNVLNLQAVPERRRIKLSWTQTWDPASAPVANVQYEIRWAVAGDSLWSSNAGNQTIHGTGNRDGQREFYIPGLQPGTKYRIGLRGKATTVDWRSWTGPPITVTEATTLTESARPSPADGPGTGSNDGPAPDRTAPDPIVDLQVSGVTETSAQLTWTAVGDDGSGGGKAEKYKILYNIWKGGSTPIFIPPRGIPAGNPPSPGEPFRTQTYTLVGLQPNKTYGVGVAVYDDASPPHMSKSNIRTFTTQPAAVPTPSVPSGAEQSAESQPLPEPGLELTLVGAQKTRLLLDARITNGDNVHGVVTCRVWYWKQRAPSDRKEKTVGLDVKGTRARVQITELDPNTTYGYRGELLADGKVLMGTGGFSAQTGRDLVPAVRFAVGVVFVAAVIAGAIWRRRGFRRLAGRVVQRLRWSGHIGKSKVTEDAEPGASRREYFEEKKRALQSDLQEGIGKKLLELQQEIKDLRAQVSSGSSEQSPGESPVSRSPFVTVAQLDRRLNSLQQELLSPPGPIVETQGEEETGSVAVGLGRVNLLVRRSEFEALVQHLMGSMGIPRGDGGELGQLEPGGFLTDDYEALWRSKGVKEEERLLSIMNRYWQLPDRKKGMLKRAFANVGLGARFRTLDNPVDTQGGMADVSFRFLESEDKCEWVWYEMEPDRLYFLLPFDDRYFPFTQNLATFRQLFDGIPKDVQQVEPKAAYRVCALHPSRKSAGGYDVSTPGLLQLKGQIAPKVAAPRDLREILGKRCDRIFGITGDTVVQAKPEGVIAAVRSDLASQAEALTKHESRLGTLESMEERQAHADAEIKKLRDEVKTLDEKVSSSQPRTAKAGSGVEDRAPLSEVSKDRFRTWAEEYIKREQEIAIGKAVRQFLEAPEGPLVEKVTQSSTEFIDKALGGRVAGVERVLDERVSGVERALDERVSELERHLEEVHKEVRQEVAQSLEGASQAPGLREEIAALRAEVAAVQEDLQALRSSRKTDQVRERGDRRGEVLDARPDAPVPVVARGTGAAPELTEQSGEPPRSGQSGEREVADWRKDIKSWWTEVARRMTTTQPLPNRFESQEYANRLFRFSDALRTEIASRGLGSIVIIEVVHCTPSQGSTSLELHRTSFLKDGGVSCRSCGRVLTEGEMSQLFLGLWDEPLGQFSLTLPPGTWNPSGLDARQRELFRNPSTAGTDIMLLDVHPPLVTVVPSRDDPKRLHIKNIPQRITLSYS